MTTYSFDQFVVALRHVETGVEPHHGLSAIGDQGRSIGPFQIQKVCHTDSRVSFPYEMCNQFEPSLLVLFCYLQRYCQRALKSGDWKTCARIWNGGPRGHKKDGTIIYWERIKGELKRLTPDDIKKELTPNIGNHAFYV